MRKVSIENNFMQWDMSILAISSGLFLTKRTNCSSFILCLAKMWDLIYKNMTSLMTMLSIKPTTSPFSILLKRCLQLSKYLSSLSRKYKNIFESIKIDVNAGRDRRLINPYVLFRMADGILQCFMAHNPLYYFGKRRDNFRFRFFHNGHRNYFGFHGTLFSLWEKYSITIGSCQGKKGHKIMSLRHAVP